MYYDDGIEFERAIAYLDSLRSKGLPEVRYTIEASHNNYDVPYDAYELDGFFSNASASLYQIIEVLKKSMDILKEQKEKEETTQGSR